LPSDTPVPQVEIQEGASPVPAGATVTSEGEIGAGIISGSPAPFASITPLPTIAPIIPPTSTSFFEVASTSNTEGTLPTDNRIGVISDDRTIFLLEDGRQVQAIHTFAFSPGGARASFEADNQLYINGVMLTISPSSQFGMPPHMRVLDMEWTADGRYLALVVEGNPYSTDQTGVWVVDTAAYTSQQIMRNDDRHATRVDWSPDGTVVLIHMNAPNGGEITFLPRDHHANDGFRSHPYPDASWSPSGTSVIVSGRGNLGRILLDAEQTFIPFTLTGIADARAATETPNGRILFLGSANGILRLYAQNEIPISLSGEIPGQVITWEWNRNRSALLLTTNTDSIRRVWVVNADGNYRDVTPPQGAPLGMYWR
jgi:hypothetical protein